MNYLKRVVISIIRHVNKSLLLFLVVFLLGNLIVGALSIHTSTNAVKSEIKRDLGAVMTVNGTKSLEERYWSNMYQMSFEKKIVEIAASFDDANPAVTSFDYLLKSSVACNDFASSYFIGSNIIETDLRENHALIGVNQAHFVDLLDQNIVLTEGRTFTQEEIDTGAHVILLNEDYQHVDDFSVSNDSGGSEITKKLSNLKVGDKVSVSTIIYEDYYGGKVFSEDTQEYEIIGFHKKNKLQSNNVFGVFIYHYEDAIYVPVNALLQTYERIEKIVDENQLSYSSDHYYPSLQSITMKLNDPEAVYEAAKELLMEYKKRGISEVEVFSSADSYEAVAGPLESLSNIANIVVVVSTVIAIFILYLIVTLFLKDRKHEIGIYLALGEIRWKILCQIFLEVYLVGILAITLSLYSGFQLGGRISKDILSSQIQKQQEVIDTKLDKLDSILPDNMESTMVLDTYQVRLSFETILMIYGISSLILLVASTLPIHLLMKTKPKNTLL